LVWIVASVLHITGAAVLRMPAASRVSMAVAALGAVGTVKADYETRSTSSGSQSHRVARGYWFS
jgi:hypothetical protein